MKAHEWLAQLSSHDIYDAGAAAQDFRTKTSLEPCWRGASPTEIRAAIKARGLGGSFHGNKPGIAGFEIAEALAHKHCRFSSDKEGRGRRFWESIEALKQADI